MRKVKFLLLMVGVLVLVFSLMPATYADEQVPTIELSPATGGQDDCGCAARGGEEQLPTIVLSSPDTVVTNDGLMYSAQEVEAGLPGIEFSSEGTGAAPEFSAIADDTPVPGLPGPFPGSVIGPDGRTRVWTTTTYPSRAIAFLRITFRGGVTGSCTGWFIGPCMIATAGHCVYDTTRGWATSITAYPGRNGSSTPYGSSTAYRLFSVTGWTVSHSWNYDYGAIQLRSRLGNTVGWFGFRWQSSNTFTGPYTVRGYPADKTYATMWTMTQNPGIRRVSTYHLFYAIDTYNGQSGSPVYHNYSTSCNPCGVAIHTYGVGADPLRQYNSGTRIRQAVFNNLRDWKYLACP